MKPEEAARLADIMAHAFDERERGWSADEIAALAAQPGVFVASAPAGFGMVRAAGGEAEILTLAVLPDGRRKGTGRALLDRLITHAGQAGATRLLLEVGETNAAARRLYEGAGFLEVGRRPRYLRRADGSREDALILARPLE